MVLWEVLDERFVDGVPEYSVYFLGVYIIGDVFGQILCGGRCSW